MSTKPKKTILGFERRTFFAASAFVLCGIGAALAFWEPQKGEAPIKRAFAQFDAKAVDHLEVTSGGKTSTFVKNGDTWSVVSPVADKADTQSISSFVDRLARVRFEGVVADKETSQASYEVTADKGVHVVAKQGDKVLADFYVGKSDGRTAYLRAASGKDQSDIFAIDGIARYDVQKDPNGWRDHTILPTYKSEEVATIEVDTPWGNTVVEKEKPSDPKAAPVPAYQAKWNVTSSPVKDKLADMDTTIAPGIANALSGLHASDIADGVTPEQAGLAPKPQGTVTLTMQNGDKYALEIGAEKGDDRYVATPSDHRIFLVASSTLERTFVSPNQFRSKDMADVKADDVVGLDITSGGEHTVLTKNGTDWKATAPATLTEVDSSKVSPVASTLESLKAVLYADETDPAKTGLDKPTSVAIFKKKDGTAVTLTVGNTKGSLYNYATVSTHPGDVYLISSYIATRIGKKSSDFAKAGAPGTATTPTPKPAARSAKVPAPAPTAAKHG